MKVQYFVVIGLITALLSLSAGAVAIMSRSPRVSKMPDHFAESLGKLCEHRDIEGDFVVTVHDPRRVGRRRYEYSESGKRRGGAQPIEGIPLEKQKIVDMQNIDGLFIVKGNNGWLLPIVLRPSFQMGIQGPYVDRLDYVSTLMKQTYPEIHIKMPRINEGEEWFLLVRCRDDDSKWRIKNVLAEDRALELLDVTTLNAAEVFIKGEQLKQILKLAEKSPYENEEEW